MKTYESPFHAMYHKEVADKMCKVCDDNPDLPYEFIRSALEACKELENGETEVFKRRDPTDI